MNFKFVNLHILDNSIPRRLVLGEELPAPDRFYDWRTYREVIVIYTYRYYIMVIKFISDVIMDFFRHYRDFRVTVPYTRTGES